MTTSRVRGPLRVGVIGAGRVGAVLGAALAAAGHRIVGTSGARLRSRSNEDSAGARLRSRSNEDSAGARLRSRSDEDPVGHSAASLARISSLLPGVPQLPADQVPHGVDLLLLAVPDDALGPLVEDLAARGALTPDQGHGPGIIVAHPSGAHGLGVLAPAVAAGAQGIALHPAMTFTGHPRDLDRLAEGISFGVTAPRHLRAFATRLVADLGGSVEWIDETARPLYHAALAHGANHLVTLTNEALDRLRDAGVLHPERVLGPLLRATLENTLAHGDDALTGPVVRGDAGTIARHLAALRGVAPDSVPAYLALARRTADRAIASGRLRAVDAVPLLGVLAQPSTVELHR